MNAKLIACNVPASDPGAVRGFYEKLLGGELARSFTEETESLHFPLSNEGHFLWLSSRTAPEEQITCVFAVDDLDEAIRDLSSLGGETFVGPIDNVPVSPKVQEHYEKVAESGEGDVSNMGRFALMRDPDGNVLALMQVESHAHRFYRLGKHRADLSEEVRAAHEHTKEVGRQLA